MIESQHIKHFLSLLLLFFIVADSLKGPLLVLRVFFVSESTSSLKNLLSLLTPWRTYSSSTPEVEALFITRFFLQPFKCKRYFLSTFALDYFGIFLDGHLWTLRLSIGSSRDCDVSLSIFNRRVTFALHV
ncbi:hypothetical protein Tco_0803428 [Tanacetum coccineum]|uniref:Secreted protein n=1 Tax=Tanacetum coccineum TaxID=301880 RepID=A0ABQ5A5R0_9ASTR